jgi:hypothetical protein
MKYFPIYLLKTTSLLVLVGAILFLPIPVKGEFDEYSVKAVFIEKLYHFVTTPKQNEIASSSKSPIFCVFGKTTLLDRLILITTMRSNSKSPFIVKKISRPTEISMCDLLFISGSENTDLEEILSFSRSKSPVLTISDTEGFGIRGVVVNMVVENENLQFEINLKEAKSLGFEFNSEVLKLARIVVR